MAQATATATFTATDTASFTFSPALTSNPPTVLACSVVSLDGTVQAASIQGQPTNTGGTVSVLGSFTGVVVIVAKD